jgi:hypothetical protein
MKALTDDEKAKMRLITDTYSLQKGDFFFHKHFVIINRSGIEKIQAQEQITVKFDEVRLDRDFVVIKATAYKGDHSTLYNGHEPVMVQTYGEAGPENCKNNYYVMTAEKRALARAVLKIVGLYQQGVFSSDEEVQNE